MEASKFCSDCGRALTPGRSFCTGCGAQVDDEPSAASPVTPQSLTPPESEAPAQYGQIVVGPPPEPPAKTPPLSGWRLYGAIAAGVLVLVFIVVALAGGGGDEK